MKTILREMQFDVRNDGRFAKIDGLVEATDFERDCLWEKYHDKSGYDWQDDGNGYLITVGETVAKNDEPSLPISFTVLFATIKGQRIAFWSDCSRIVDHDLISEWFKVNVPNARKTNAQNFHNIFR